MSLKTAFLAASLLGILLSTSASASEEFAIPTSVELPAYDFADRKIDIVGFRPGMGYDEAVELLKQRKPGTDIQLRTMRFGTQQVKSESFTSLIFNWEGEDDINIFLASPSVGNKVYGVSRRVDFDDEAKRPDFADTLASLTAKYGPPSAVDEVKPNPQYVNRKSMTTTLMWYLGGEGKCDLKKFNVGMAEVAALCTKPVFATGPSINGLSYNIQSAKTYADTASGGSDIIIVASVYSRDGLPRVSSMTTSFTDVKTRAASVAADLKLIESEQSKFASVKVAAPEL